MSEALDAVRGEYDQYDEDMSADAVVAVREHLEISRRTASIPGFWHWLALLKFPEFVRHRWDPDDDLEEKFLAAGRDIYSNALHRLWWITELTRDEGSADPYERTRRVLNRSQQFTNRVFDYWFARHEETTKAVVDVLLEEDDFDVVDGTVQKLRH